MGRRLKIDSEEDVRCKIIDHARQIIEKEGFDRLSIRRITSRSGYSPGIFYHYFSGKDEIVNILLFDWYSEIMEAIGGSAEYTSDPKREIYEKSWSYYSQMLKRPGVYREFLLTQDQQILRHTRILTSSDSEISQPLRILMTLLEAGIEKGQFNECDVVMTAQIIWTSLFGLIIKVMTEGIKEEQVQEEYFKQLFHMIFKGLAYE